MAYSFHVLMLILTAFIALRCNYILCFLSGCSCIQISRTRERSSSLRFLAELEAVRLEHCSRLAGGRTSKDEQHCGPDLTSKVCRAWVVSGVFEDQTPE